jgi:hypothetical protein
MSGGSTQANQATSGRQGTRDSSGCRGNGLLPRLTVWIEPSDETSPRWLLALITKREQNWWVKALRLSDSKPNPRKRMAPCCLNASRIRAGSIIRSSSPESGLTVT